MIIRRLRQIDYLFLGVLIVYLIDIGDLKYAMAALFAVFYMLWGFANRRVLTMRGMGRGFFTILCGLCVLFFITFILQILNGFQSYAINEVIYFITPLFVVWAYISVTDKKMMERMLDYIFIICLFSFFMKQLPLMTVENFKSINFLKSYSPFESGFGYTFLMYEWMYLYKHKKKKAIFSMVLCIMCFKRFCAICSVVLFVLSKWLATPKRVGRKAFFTAVVVYVLIPVLTCLFVNDEFAEWFYNAFGMSLAELTLTRSTRIGMVVNSDQIKYGLGSTTVYMTEVYQEIHQSKVEQWNLHNDIVRIYVECGLLGTIAFTYSYFKAAAWSCASFTLMCYIFAECNFNHFFGAGSVFLWLITYLMLAYFAADSQQTNNMAK